MPRRNDPGRREERRAAAEARQEAAETARRAVMTPAELRAYNAALAAEKAARAEGLGHFRPELRPVELVALKHISRFKVDRSGHRTEVAGAEKCPIVDCGSCEAEAQDALGKAIGQARAELRDKRHAAAKSAGNADRARGASLARAGL